MSYVHDQTFAIVSSATSITVPLPDHAQNDGLIIWVVKGANTNTLSIGSGFTELLENGYFGTRVAVYHKVAGASETDPTVTISSGTDVLHAHCFTIKDINTGGIFDPTNPYVISTHFANSGTTTALTTTEDNQLILHLVAADSQRNIQLEDSVMFLPFYRDQLLTSGAAYDFQASSGSTNPVSWNQSHSDDGQIVTLAIRSSGTPVVPPACSGNAGTLFSFMDSYSTGPFSGGSTDPSADFSTINSITYNYDAFGVLADANRAYGYDGILSQFNTSGGISGGIWDCNSVDLTGEKVCMHVMPGRTIDPKFVPTFSSVGVILGLKSGTTTRAYRFWHVSGFDSSPNIKSLHAVVIDPADTNYTFGSDVGTFDITDITGIFFGYNRDNTGSTQSQLGAYIASELGTATLILGSSGRPCMIESFQDIVQTHGLETVINQGGLSAKQWQSLQKLKVGNGTDVVYFEDSGVSLEFPEIRNEADKKGSINVDEGYFGIEFEGVLGDTIKLTDSTITGVSTWNFDISSGSTSAATWDFAGLILNNANVTLRDIFATAASALTFRNCPTFTGNSADLSGGCLFDNTRPTITSEADFQNYYNCEFKNRDGAGESAILITGNQSGTWSDPNLTVSNNTYDIEYSGTTNFTIESATTLTVNNSSSGVLTIDTPTVQLTVNSSEASSDIKIFDTGTQTIEASATGTTVNTTAAGTYDITVQKSGFLPQRQVGVVLGASSVTVDITLVPDEVYVSSHGLTFTTDYSYDANTRIMTIVANQEGRDLYSALIDDFITQTSLRNCPFPLAAVGPDRIDFNAVGYYNSAATVGATIDSGDIQFWKGAGMEWEHDTTGNPTKKFYSVISSNTLQAGSVVGYTQENNGTPSEATLVSNKVNQVIQFFEDTNGDGTPDYNYTGHLLFKGFQAGYYQARWDVINDSGVTTLEPYEYGISLLQDPIAGATGNQSITITTLTDHTSSPKNVSGFLFDYELVDPGTNSAENLLSQYNYDVFTAVDTAITTTLYTSYTAFDLPDLIVEAGANYETERGYFEGDGAVTDLSGVYVSRATADHPDISRFESNDGTYYAPATVAQISAPNLTVGRIQICNETARVLGAWAATTAYSVGDRVLRTTGTGTDLGDGVFMVCTTAGTSGGSEPPWDVAADGNTTNDGTAVWTVRPIEFDNSVTSGAYSNSWTNGEHFTSGDTIRMRWVDADEEEILATNVATVSGTSTFLNTPVDDDVYDAYGITGSSVTEYSADVPNIQVDVTDPDNVFYLDRFYAWWKYNLTTEAGIRNFFGGITAIDTSNLLINNSIVDIFFDNTKATSARQGDQIVIRRADGAYPQVTVTSGGGGLGFYYQGIGYSTSSGSGLDTTERNKLLGLRDFDPESDALEGALNYDDALRIMLAESAGKVNKVGNTYYFRNQADDVDRIISETDEDGQRVTVTVNGA